jgi:hypothetical protein
MNVHVDVKYKAGHSYPENWVRGELFCPQCGIKGVWEEQGPGDWYVGSDYLCQACGSVFTIQGHNKADYTDEQVLAEIRRQRVA